MRTKRLATIIAAGATLLAGAATAQADHPAPAFAPQAPLSSTFNSGGQGAKWELITSIPTGNPHSDLDFFTQRGNVFASVGTLATGPNAGGQTLVQLTDGGAVRPRFVSGHPSATCITDPSQATGLQHDVEASPKGETILNAANPAAVRSDAQLIVDATDNPGRCHDQGALGVEAAPQGGLEIIDVTNINDPVEIGLTSNIGEAHTVNIDPKRPHIAYAVTSDAVGVDENGKRLNEVEGSADRLDLDGFEVIDMASCMNFRPGTTVTEKRAACRPQVFRYRYPTTQMAQGHTQKTGTQGVFGCHELELYANDRLTCGSGNAAIYMDMSNAFDDRGTPGDFTDDKPRGRPLPCRVRGSSTVGFFGTGASVTDCRDGEGPGASDLDVPSWLASGAPSLEGVRYIGSAHHQGRGAGGAATPAFDSTQDIDFNHETELTESGRFLIASDERGGGITPPGATCSPAPDVRAGNGGLHGYAVNRLTRSGPGTAAEAQKAYARTRSGAKSIYRAPIRTQTQGAFCTAHVFQQIPGQNRIFMGWYSQGTQVVDFTERSDGTLEFKEAGYFIPENANTWVSHIFKMERNANGSFTYYGATGDFLLGNAGRNAIDVYKVTLPPPPLPAAGAQACPSRTPARRTRSLRRGNRATVTATLTRQGQRVRGASVRLRGAGVVRTTRTNSRGQATFRITARRGGQARISTSTCAGVLRVRAAQTAAPRFTG